VGNLQAHKDHISEKRPESNTGPKRGKKKLGHFPLGCKGSGQRRRFLLGDPGQRRGI